MALLNDTKTLTSAESVLLSGGLANHATSRGAVTIASASTSAAHNHRGTIQLSGQAGSSKATGSAATVAVVTGASTSNSAPKTIVVVPVSASGDAQPLKKFKASINSNQ